MNPSKHKMGILAQIFKLIPGNLIPKLAAEHEVDKQSRSFSSTSHVANCIDWAKRCGQDAIRWQVWTALLTYILLRFIAWQSKWGHRFRRLFTALRGVVWCGVALKHIG